MNQIQTAAYARVSSEQQTDAGTIKSQLAALRKRVEKDGLSLPSEMLFIDEGYSGATLIRPALERLRDFVAMQGIDRVYVHSPDRLARKYAYQVLIIDEFQRAGVDVIFLNRNLGQSPEDDLLLQVQGMIAEYERAKIMERSRRGKRYAAKNGQISVLSGAPYGYRYITKQEGGGQASYEIIPDEARVVRQIFNWIGKDRVSIGDVCRRLMEANECTRSGKTTWDRTTIWGILKNPAYKGTAAFGKTKNVPLRPRLRAQRGVQLQPRRPASVENTPKDEWITIPVPALVSEDLFEVAQQQLEENRQRARQNKRGATHLLQGLLVCAQCQYAYYGKFISKKASKGKLRNYAYYRCIGTDAYRFGGERVCDNTQVRTDMLDEFVWNEVVGLLSDPQRIEREYKRRLDSSKNEHDDLRFIQTQQAKVRQGIGRLIDSYTEGFVTKEEFEPRIKRLRQRLDSFEKKGKQLTEQANMQKELRLIITCLEEFATNVQDSLLKSDWLTRRELIRVLVKKIEVGKDEVNVVFRVTPPPFDFGLIGGRLQHCLRGDNSSLWGA